MLKSTETPVMYSWFGPEVPQDYLIQLSQLQYPVIFYKNPPLNREFSRELKQFEKADYFRLQWIYENGGIYSDFDNKIDYDCMIKALQPYRESGQLIFWWDPKRNKEVNNVVANSFIYASRPKLPSLKGILDKVSEQNQGIEFAGMKFLNQFEQVHQVEALKECIFHEYDFSWVKESQTPNRQFKESFAAKVEKKEQVKKDLKNALTEKEFFEREASIYKQKSEQLNQQLVQERKQRYTQRLEHRRPGEIDSLQINLQGLISEHQESNEVNSQLEVSSISTENRQLIRTVQKMKPIATVDIEQQMSGELRTYELLSIISQLSILVWLCLLLWFLIKRCTASWSQKKKNSQTDFKELRERSLENNFESPSNRVYK